MPNVSLGRITTLTQTWSNQDGHLKHLKLHLFQTGGKRGVILITRVSVVSFDGHTGKSILNDKIVYPEHLNGHIFNIRPEIIYTVAQKYGGGIGPKYHRSIGIDLYLSQTILNEKKAVYIRMMNHSC